MLNAIFASAEIAVLSINETKLEKMANEGNGKAKRLFKLTREPAKFLATIQVAITLAGFLGSAFAAENFAGPLANKLIKMGVDLPYSTVEGGAVIVITLILSYFTLIFGELVPKRMAMKKSEAIAMGISGLISGISVVFKPIVFTLSISTNLVLRLFGIDPNEADEEVSEEEIRMMVDAGSAKGTIQREEKEFIQKVFEFNDKKVSSIATHRTEVVLLWLEDDMAVWDEVIHNSRHTLYPVCDDTKDNIVGVLNAKDYFRLKDKSREKVMEAAVFDPYFVYEATKADILFRNLKATKNSMAIIIDEHGGMVGIVTINDLVEELVGDLNDDDDDVAEGESFVRKIGDNLWEVRGNVELEEVEEALAVEIKRENCETLTGLVFEELGLIPKEGVQKIQLVVGGLHISVVEVKEHRIERAFIRVLEEEAC